MARLDRWLRRHPLIVDAAFAAVLAAVLFPSTAPLVTSSTSPAAVKMAVLAAFVVAHATVAVRRWLPAAAYGTCCAAMLMLVVTPPLSGVVMNGDTTDVPAILLPSSLVFTVLLYSIAAHGSGRQPFGALLVAVLGAAVTTVGLAAAEVMSAVVPAGWPIAVIIGGALGAVVIAAWSLGRFRKLRQDSVLALAERARRAEADREQRLREAAERERARIATEMHDVVAHSLAVVVAQAEAGRMAAVTDPARGAAVLPVIVSTGREAMSDMRALLGVLRQPPAETPQDERPHRDDSASPQPGLRDIPGLVDRLAGTGLPVRLHRIGPDGGWTGAEELVAYRVVQESLTNVIKHAGPVTQVAVMVDSTDGLTVTVTDDGIGSGDSDGLGGGLTGMRARVQAVGGHWSAGPSNGRGWAVTAQLAARAADVPAASADLHPVPPGSAAQTGTAVQTAAADNARTHSAAAAHPDRPTPVAAQSLPARRSVVGEPT
jgi:signal transduction histidine kinase